MLREASPPVQKSARSLLVAVRKTAQRYHRRRLADGDEQHRRDGQDQAEPGHPDGQLPDQGHDGQRHGHQRQAVHGRTVRFVSRKTSLLPFGRRLIFAGISPDRPLLDVRLLTNVSLWGTFDRAASSLVYVHRPDTIGQGHTASERTVDANGYNRVLMCTVTTDEVSLSVLWKRGTSSFWRCLSCVSMMPVSCCSSSQQRRQPSVRLAALANETRKTPCCALHGKWQQGAQFK